MEVRQIGISLYHSSRTFFNRLRKNDTEAQRQGTLSSSDTTVTLLDQRPLEDPAINPTSSSSQLLPTPDSIIDIPGHAADATDAGGNKPDEEVEKQQKQLSCFARVLKRAFGAKCASSWTDYFAVDPSYGRDSPTLVRVFRAVFAVLSCCSVFYCLKNRDQVFTGEPGARYSTQINTDANLFYIDSHIPN